MGPLDVFFHLLGFVAPALALALLLPLAARLVLPGAASGARWKHQVAANFIAGASVLAGGLWLFGVDGKMATYAALVVVMASCQWLGGRAWRG